MRPVDSHDMAVFVADAGVVAIVPFSSISTDFPMLVVYNSCAMAMVEAAPLPMLAVVVLLIRLISVVTVLVAAKLKLMIESIAANPFDRREEIERNLFTSVSHVPADHFDDELFMKIEWLNSFKLSSLASVYGMHKTNMFAMNGNSISHE